MLIYSFLVIFNLRIKILIWFYIFAFLKFSFLRNISCFEVLKSFKTLLLEIFNSILFLNLFIFKLFLLRFFSFLFFIHYILITKFSMFISFFCLIFYLIYRSRFFTLMLKNVLSQRRSLRWVILDFTIYFIFLLIAKCFYRYSLRQLNH